MYKQHLEYLACPICQGDFVLKAKKEDNAFVQEGVLCCDGCDKEYLIINGIPRFVPQSNYADSFGFEWNMHKKTQYDDKSGVEASKRRFFEETRWEEAKDSESCVVLEAGCGSGRFTPYAIDVAGGGL